MTRTLLPAASTLALGACAHAPAPSPTTDMVSVPATLSMAPADAAASEEQLAALLPDDPGFDMLVARTLDDGPDLAAAMARIDVARAGAARARAERLPSIGYDAGVEARRSNPAQFGADAPAAIAFDTEQVAYAANLSARWDADLFGRLKAGQRAAAYRLDAATADAAAVRNALVAEIAGAVVDWRAIDAQGEALAADARAAEELGRLAKVREEAGLAPGIQSERAAAQAAAAKTRIAALAGQQALILGRLVALTALPADEVRTTLGQEGRTLQAPPPPALPSTLLARRPDVAAAAARLSAADAEVASAAAARFPRLDLSAGIGLLAFALGDLFDSDSIVGSLAAGIAGPLLDFGRIDAEIDAAEAQTRIAFQDYRRTVFTALGDAEAAYGLVEAADTEAAAARLQADASTRAARLTRMRLDAGLADLSAALEAQRLADAGEAEAAAATGRASRARIRLWQALGGSPLSTD